MRAVLHVPGVPRARVTRGVRFSTIGIKWTEEMGATDVQMAHVRYALCRGGDGNKDTDSQ